LSIAVLDRLQRDLQAIYRVDSDLTVSDFVVGQRSASGAPEELLVRENDGELEVGLYVDRDVLSELAVESNGWTHRRLAAHCQAVEGVSHFLYLTNRAGVPRPVSQLELELQAEIDKFATVVLALWEVGRRNAVGMLRERLFHQVSYRGNLTIEERERYEKANLLARLYCAFLETRYVLRNSIEGFLADLRRMYRLGAGDKLSYAARGTAL